MKQTVCLMIKKLGKKYYSGTKVYAAELYDKLKKQKDIDVILISAPEGSVWEKYNILFFIYGLYKILGLVLRKKIHVYHGLSHVYSPYLPILKLFGVKTFLTILDVPDASMKDSRYFDGKAVEVLLYKLFKLFIRFADHYFVISELNKQRLIDMEINEKRITITHLGAEKKFRPIIGLRNFDDPKIGFMGGRLSKKTLINIVKILKIFRNINKKYPNCKFIISGVDKNNRIEKIMKKEKNIEYRKFIPWDEVEYFYNKLYLFIHLSDYEGFGLSIIESQLCGTPVFILKDAVISEEVSKTCLKVEFDNLEKKIELFLNNKSLWEKLSRKGLKYCKRFTWIKSINKTINTYKKLSSI